jgi:hypothetical protein
VLPQFAEDGTTLYVGETWAGRVSRWNATSGAYLGLAGVMQYPLGLQLCRAGTELRVVAAEFVTDRFGEQDFVSRGTVLAKGATRQLVRGVVQLIQVVCVAPLTSLCS